MRYAGFSSLCFVLTALGCSTSGGQTLGSQDSGSTADVQFVIADTALKPDLPTGDAASPPLDVPSDVPVAPPDVAPDAGVDIPLELPGDIAEPDTSPPPTDVPSDVPPDVTPDAPADVLADTAPDAAPDTGPDAGPGTEGDTADAGQDTAPIDAGPTFAPFAKLPCAKSVNLNLDGTVNPYISPARNGHFYVSWVAKGGNLMLTWESPADCKTAEGPFQVNTTKGEVYYWGGIAVVSDPEGNFYAVWESSTQGKDISFAWSETGKSFSTPIELVTTSTNGQDPALWVPAAGVVHAAWRGHHPTLKQYDTYYAQGTKMFAGGTFSTGTMVNGDSFQDDQVAIVGDGKNTLYFAWQRFDGDILVARSTDNGVNWSAPVQINDVTGKANVGKATFMTRTPEGRVVVIWSDDRKQKSGNENDVFADSSADGLTWGVDVQVNDNDARYQEDPSLAVGMIGGCKGAVYAVWQDMRNKQSFDIYAARSIDGGLTWSTNEAVANDLEGDEMNPAIAVDASCTVGVAWRDSVKNANFDIGTAYMTW